MIARIQKEKYGDSREAIAKKFNELKGENGLMSSRIEEKMAQPPPDFFWPFCWLLSGGLWALVTMKVLPKKPVVKSTRPWKKPARSWKKRATRSKKRRMTTAESV